MANYARTITLAAILSLLVLAAPSLGQTVVVDIDPAFPSGGSGAPLVFSGGGVAEVVLDTSDPGPGPPGRPRRR
jgi:hypothetical protein